MRKQGTWEEKIRVLTAISEYFKYCDTGDKTYLQSCVMSWGSPGK